MANYNIEMNMLNSSGGYDVLYPKTNWNNIINVPNIEESLLKYDSNTVTASYSESSFTVSLSYFTGEKKIIGIIFAMAGSSYHMVTLSDNYSHNISFEESVIIWSYGVYCEFKSPSGTTFSLYNGGVIKYKSSSAQQFNIIFIYIMN